MPLNPAGVPSREGIQDAIDEAVAAALGTLSWTDLTHEGTAGVVKYAVVAGWVQVEASVSIVVPTATVVTLVTTDNAIPEPHRPSQSLNLAIVRTNLGASGIVTRSSNGSISVSHNAGSSAASVQFAYSYPIGA